MKKIAVTFLACLFEIMLIAAQTLSETEVCATMNRAFELQKAKQYKEALTAFLTVGANVKPDKSEVERKVYVISQTMACSCQYKLGLYEDGYQLAKKLIKCKLEDEEKDDIYYCYTLNGYELACNQLKPEEDADYDKCRELLFEIAPYADGQVKKNVSLRIPLTWFSEGLSHFESQRFDKAFPCFENALNCYMELGLLSNAITVLKQLGWMHNYTGHIGEAIANYEQALSLSIQTANESSQMIIAEELLRLSKTIGDMASVAKYTEMIDSIVANTTDDQVKFDHYCMIGLDAQNNGRFQLAEQCFLKGKDIAEIENPVNKNANKY
ncbi:MAG: tetratricopeptide repeat protein [Candidatus Cryptobacteroides sp.]